MNKNLSFYNKSNQTFTKHALPILQAQKVDNQMQKQIQTSRIPLISLQKPKKSVEEVSEPSAKFFMGKEVRQQRQDSKSESRYQETHPKMISVVSLKSMLESKKERITKKSGYSIQSVPAAHHGNMTGRDVSHLVDGKSFRNNNKDAHQVKEQKMARQLTEKSELAYSRFQDYLISQGVKQQQQKKFASITQNKEHTQELIEPKDDTFLKIIQIVENFQDVSLYETIQNEIRTQDVKHKTQSMSLLLGSLHQSNNSNTNHEDQIQSQEGQRFKFLKEDLQKTSQHFFSNQPSGRVDATNLKQWLQYNLQVISQNQLMDYKEKYQKADEILFISLNELIRQVAYNCLERGQLIHSIFKGYLILMKKRQKINIQEKQTIKILNYKQELELQNTYQGTIDEVKLKVNELNIQLQTLSQQSQIQKEELFISQTNEKKLHAQLLVNKLIQKNAAVVIKNLQRETQELRIKIIKMKTITETVGGITEIAQPLKRQSQQNNIINNSILGQPRDGSIIPTQSDKYHTQISLQDDDNEDLLMLLKQNDQKSSVEMNRDIIVKDTVEEIPPIMDTRSTQTESIKNNQDVMCQTTLELISTEYDRLLSKMEIDEQVRELYLKDQINQFTTFNFSEDHQKIAQQQDQSPGIRNVSQMSKSSRAKKQNAASPIHGEQRLSFVNILNGLPGNVDQIKNMEKVDMFDMFINNINLLKQILDKQGPSTLENFDDYSQEASHVKIDHKASSFQPKSKQMSKTDISMDQSLNELVQTRKNSLSKQPKIAISNVDDIVLIAPKKKQQNMKVTKKLVFQSQQSDGEQQVTQKIFLQSQKSDGEPQQFQTDIQQNKTLIETIPQQGVEAIPILTESVLVPQQDEPVVEKTFLGPVTLEDKEQIVPSFNQDKKITLIKTIEPKMIQSLSVQNKFGFTKGEQSSLKTQLTLLIMIYNMQVQKNHNLQKSVGELLEFVKQIFDFSHKLLMHIVRTQKSTHKQIIEVFMQEFQIIRNKIPKEYDHDINQEDLNDDEDDDEIDKEKKKQNKLKNQVLKSRRITKALQFNFQSKQNKPNIFDKLTHPGVLIALKVKEQSNQLKKTINFWPLRNVLKTITQLYDEKVRLGRDNQVSKDLDMQIFMFNNFLNRYGFKTVAEKKYLQFLVSVQHFNSIFRVNVFSRVSNIINEETLSFTNDETAFFLQGLEYMNIECQLGMNIIHSEGEQKYYVPYLRGLDYIEAHLENKMNLEELRDLRNDLENLKENDPKNLNKAGLIDVDIFMVKVLAKYRVITIRTKLFVIHAFQAADLDGNKKINLNEFLTLYRHIEATKFNFKVALDLFDEAADIISSDEKNLSFEKFTAVCVNQQIFQEDALNTFLNLGKQKLVEEEFEIAQSQWFEYKREIQRILTELQPSVTEEIYKNWNEILETLEQRIQQIVSNDQMKPILIAHKILRCELQRLVHIGQQEDEFEDFEDDKQIKKI